ncbi:unnamed protein product [Rotaria magnacalcarata]|uniref:Uncharacterized protein n=2 Tax=Rotaria magnacalcarata TaxID=392030 RepID=A0A816QK96_9BILA|nr:unnamed protein product [Rotaria magnacalcarata]
MENRVSSSFNSNNKNENISLSNNSSTCTANSNSTRHHCREYESSYPSISRYRTSLSSSPYRKIHYLDDSDEEIINEEIIDITTIDHYPTLIERWGDDAKTIIKHDGEFIIEDYVEFEETEPTIMEEISYEIIYSDGQIKSTREVQRSYVEARNFSKIKKRRIKRKRSKLENHSTDINERATQLLYEMRNLSSEIDSMIQTTNRISNSDNDLSGDNDEITTINRTTESIIKKESNENSKTIPNQGNDCSNIEIIGNETLFSGNEQILLQSHNSNEQQPQYQSDLISQRVDDDEETRQSYLLAKNEHHISHNDHDTHSLAKSSITDDHKKMLEFRLQSTDSESALEKKTSVQHQVQSIESDTQSTITIEHNFGQDLQSFIIQTNELISNIDSRNASSSNQLNKNMDIDTCNDSTTETYEVIIEFEKEQIGDQSFIRSRINCGNRLSNSNNTPSVMETKQDEFKCSSSTEIDANTLTTAFNLQSSSDNFTKKQSPTSTSFVTQVENEPERLSSINHTMETYAQTQKPFLRSSIDNNQQGSTMNTTQDETVEHSSDVSPDKLRQIETTYFPSIDNVREIIEKTANDSINQIPLISTPLTNIDDNITTTLLSNEALSDSLIGNAQFSIQDIISNESELLKSTYQDELFNDIDTKSFSSSQSIKFYDINTDSLSDPYNNLQQYADTNTADLITTDSCYSTHDLSSSSTESFTADSSFKTDFQDLNQSEYFITRNIEPISSEFPSIDIEESDKKTEASDLTKIYFELQERRNNAPLHVYQEKSNDNHIGLKSFPQVTNLLSTEYYRVFGVSNDIINPVSDITKSGDLAFQSKDSNENKSICIDDNQSIIPSVTSNLELDFRYSSLLNRVDTLIQPLLNSPSTTENESMLSNAQRLNERNDARMNYINILDEVTNNDQHILESSHNNESINQKNILSNDMTSILSWNQSQIESNTLSDQQTKTSVDDKISNVTEQIQNFIENIRHKTESIEQKNITKASSALKFNDAVMPTSESIITPLIETKTKIGAEKNQQSTTESFDRVKHFLPAALLSSTPNTTHTEPIQPIEKKQKQDESDRKIVDVNDSFSTFAEPTDGLDDISSIRQQLLAISNYSDNNRLQNTLTGNNRTADNTQGQLNQNIEQSLIPKSSYCGNQSIIVDPGCDRLSSIQSTSTRDQQKQDKTGDKSSDQKISTMYDDYPWYLSYYTIVDAEAKFTRLYKQFNFINTQRELSPTTVHIQSEFDNAQEPNDDGFHVVQRRKRVSSSTTLTHNEKSTNTMLSPDIDLEPVVLRGHPHVPIVMPPIISQTTDTVNKKKHKKKKKDNKETIFFDAPEFVPSDVNQEQNHKSQITEQLSSMPTNLDKDESQKEFNETAQTTEKTQDECENKGSSQNTQHMSDFIDKQQQQQPSPITVNIQSELNEIVSTHNHVLDESSAQDDGGFHVVQRRKRIPSSNTQAQIIPTTNTIFSPDIDLEPVVLHGNPGVPVIVSPLILQPADTVSKKKHKKKKRDEKEMIFFDAPEFIPSDVNKQQNDKLHSELVERVSPNSIQTINSSDAIAETAHIMDDKSPITHNMLLMSSDCNNRKSQEKYNESVQIIDNKQEHIDQNARQSFTSKNSCYSQQPKIADSECQHLCSIHQTSVIDHRQQGIAGETSLCQKVQVMYDDYPWYSSHYTIVDTETKFARLYKELSCINKQQQLSTTIVNIQSEVNDKLTTHEPEFDNKGQPDDDGFHLVQRRKRVPSSTTQSQVIPTINTTLSLDIDLEPVVLRGHPSVVFTQSTIADQLSSMPINLDKDESQKEFNETAQTTEKTQDECENKGSSQDTQLMSDFIDKQQQQQPSPITVNIQSELNENVSTHNHVLDVSSEQDDGGFHVVQRRKRIPSSNTQARIIPTTNTIFSSDIDLEPVVLHGHPSAPIPTPLILSQPEDSNRVLENSTEQSDDGFHVVQRRKCIPSSTTQTQGDVPTTTTLSSDVDLESVALQEYPSVPIATPRMTSPTLDTVCKKKHKKKKKDKQETIPFDAPEFVSSDKLQSQFVEKQCSTNIETVDSSNAFAKSETVPDDESVITEQVLSTPINPEQDESDEHLNHIVQTLDNEQHQIIRPTQQSLIIDSTNYSNRLANVNRTDDLLSSAHPTSAVDNEKQDTKSSSQNVQAMSDFINKQQLSPAEVTIQSELNEIVFTQDRLLDITREQDDDDEFHVVQYHKRIPSSTTQTQSEILTTTALRSDIDLAPVVLHGHPDIPIIARPIDSQTVNTASKKKHKKKKKDTQETIFFDALEIVSSDINKSQQSDTRKSQSVKNESTNADSSQIILTIEPAFVPSEILSTLTADEQKGKTLSKSIIANDDDGKNEWTSDNAFQSISTPVRAVLENVKLISSSKVEQSIDNRSNVQSLPSSIIKTKTIMTVESPKEDDNNEGFHPVHYHKRTLALPKPEKTTSASTIASKEIHNANLDFETSVIHENQNLSMPSTTTNTDDKTSKTKNTKQKKRKQEVASASNEQTTHEETTPILSSSIIENSNVQLKPTLPSIVSIKKMSSPSEDEKEEEDNEGFQVVKYRKHSNTTSQSRKVQQSSPKTKNSHEQYFNRKYVGPTGRYDSAFRPIPRNIPLRKTLSNKTKQDSYPTSIFTGSPRSASTGNRIITSTSVPNSFNTPKDMKQTTQQLKPLENVKNQTIISTTPKPHQSFSIEQSSKPIVQEYHASTHTEKKTGNEKSTVLNIASTKTREPTLIQDDDNDGFQLVRHQKNKTSTTAKQPKLTSPIDKKTTFTYVKQELSTITTTTPTVSIEQAITPQEKSKKSKKNKEPTPPSPIAHNSSTISITNEGQDQTANMNVQKIPQLPIEISNHLFSTEDKTISKPITNEIITSQANEQVHPTDNIQSLLTSIISSQEVSKPSNKPPDEVEPIHISQTSSPDILRVLNETEEVVIKNIASTADIKHEQIKTLPNEKPSQRRKKEPRTETKAGNTNVLLSSTIATIESDNDKQKLNSSTVQKSKIIESKAVQPQKSQQISTKKQHITNRKFETTELLTTASSQSTPPMRDNKSYEVANSKLDLFLPDYIRQQINTRQTSSSLIDNSNMSQTTITASDMIQKKKQRAKMLTKDHEAKSLLTNEFDTTINNEKIVSADIKNITDIDEFIIQTDQTNNISSQQNIDNILSRGFNLWLHEGQALSQQNDKSKSNRNLTHTLQSIIAQPLAINDDVEDSYTTSQTMQSIFTADVRTEKRIHVNNAYFINHPKSLSTPSCIENRSNEKKSDDDDDSRKYDSDNDEDSTNDRLKKRRSHQADRHVLTKDKRKTDSNNDNNLQINFSTDDVQRCLGEDFYHQLENNNINNNNNNNNTINFDDWAHFLEQQNSQQIESNPPASLECFYAETLDDDTLLSNSVPNNSSIPHQKPRYGDFSKSDHEIIIPESMIKLPSCKSKPSDIFRRWRKPQSITNQIDNDDEIFILHSTNGLCRQVTP